MAQAKWLDMTFEVNPEKGVFSLINDLSVSSKIREDSNSDVSGQKTTNAVARDLTSFSFKTKVISTADVDAREIAEQWDSHIGHKAPFYINDKVFLFENFQLISCSWNPKLNPSGFCESVEISLEFKEYAPQKVKAKQKSTTKSSSSKKSSSTKKTSSSKKSSGTNVDKDAAKKADTRVNGYKSQTKTGASSSDKKGV